jgi:curved DNA-binding protein CbpA
MSAPPAQNFQDHYFVLGIQPDADSESIHRAYSQLASRYHARNAETADEAKFKAVTLAYEVLSDPASRVAFDALRSGPAVEAPPQFSGLEFFSAVSGEVMRRHCILCLLYDRRRKKPATPGLSPRQIETMVAASVEELQFSIWYLKQKGWALSDDKSNLQISVQGMEHLESHFPDAASILALLKASGSNGTAP